MGAVETKERAHDLVSSLSVRVSVSRRKLGFALKSPVIMTLLYKGRWLENV